jgi:hypothetical protein
MGEKIAKRCCRFDVAVSDNHVKKIDFNKNKLEKFSIFFKKNAAEPEDIFINSKKFKFTQHLLRVSHRCQERQLGVKKIVLSKHAA